MGVVALDLIGSGNSAGHRLLLTLALVGAVVVCRLILIGAVVAIRRNPDDHARFWVWQLSNLAALICIVVGALLIWSDNPSRLASGLGIAGAGVAIAAQRVVTSFAGYLVILSGRAFTVGDRIKMGAVQGDVIALGFLQTRVLEMGQPTPVNEQESPGMWVHARQYSGRIVTVTNDKVFDEAVYNFTREFPFFWDEIVIPVPYGSNQELAEQIVLAAARDATSQFVEESRASREAFNHRYAVELDGAEPRVCWMLTDNWVQLTVRFFVSWKGARDIKDRMARQILREDPACEAPAGTSWAILFRR